MKKMGKLSLIALIIITLVMGFIIGFMNISVPKTIKQELSKQVYELTGSRLSIEENVQWSFFPFGMVAHKIVLNNPPEFGQTPLATAEEVRFSVQVLPLFSHQVKIKKIIVKELNLKLIKTVSGKENWQRFFAIMSGSKIINNTKNQAPAIMSEKPLWILNITSDLMYNSKTDEFSIPTFKVKINNTTFNGNLTGTLNPSLSAKGELQSESLAVGKLLFTNVRSPIDAQGSLISLNALKATLSEGDYTGNVLINLHGEVPTVTLSGKLVNADVAKLLKDVISKVPFSGKLGATTQLSFIVGDVPRLKKSLNGNFHFDIQDGVLHGINIPALIQFGQSIIQEHVLPHFRQLNQTDFGQLKGSFQIKNGIMTNQDLTLRSSQLEGSGHGKIDLTQENIDYTLQAGLIGHTTKIPISIRGSFDNPTIGASNLEISQSTLDKNINLLKEKLNKRLQKYNLGIA